MSKKLQIRRGVSTVRTTITPSVGEPYCDNTTNRLFLGDGATAGGVPAGGQQCFQQLAIAGPSAALTIAFPPGFDSYLGNVTVTAGGSAFTIQVILPITAARISGDGARFLVPMPASANPTITFYSGATSNPILATIAPDSVKARTYNAEFFYDGAAWQFLDLRQRV